MTVYIILVNDEGVRWYLADTKTDREEAFHLLTALQTQHPERQYHLYTLPAEVVDALTGVDT